MNKITRPNDLAMPTVTTGREPFEPHLYPSFPS